MVYKGVHGQLQVLWLQKKKTLITVHRASIITYLLATLDKVLKLNCFIINAALSKHQLTALSRALYVPHAVSPPTQSGMTAGTMVLLNQVLMTKFLLIFQVCPSTAV